MTSMSTTPENVPQQDGSLTSKNMRRVLGSSFAGSAIEFYDFLLYATTAAVVFPVVFFPNVPPAVAAFASFTTLAAGYVARPLGGIIFGHFGDRLGRKGVLVTSMLMMGTATAAIGLLPPSSQIGAAAPILLVCLRVIQGLAVGGEWGGAMLIALEHAPGGKRGFAASFANLGAPAGSALASGSVALVSLLPDDQFFSWGWRIPFVFSIVLVTLGMFVRLKVAESPVFEKLENEAKKRRLPLVEVLTRSPKNLVLGILAALSQLTISGVVTVWAVNYAVEAGAGRTGVLNAKTMSAFILFLTTMISARASDRFGRKPVLMAGIILAIIWAYPVLLLIQAGTVTTFAIGVGVSQAIQGIILGPLAGFLAELFSTATRFTGASICFQTASAIGAGFTPVVASAVIAATGSITALGVAWIVVLAACLVGVLLAPEGRRRDLATIA
ncbi:MAG: MFS transporter [Streptosporangiales bacterium]|nr:MFS transporter [Streptosporangiales bacterium]